LQFYSDWRASAARFTSLSSFGDFLFQRFPLSAACAGRRRVVVGIFGGASIVSRPFPPARDALGLKNGVSIRPEMRDARSRLSQGQHR
jgi:hypothetical protein